MKKFLSLFIALAMVLSLFAGVGAKSAKAAVPAGTVTLTAAQTAPGATTVDLSWTYSGTDTVLAYNIYRNQTGALPTAADLKYTVAASPKQDTGLTVGQGYFYWVAAVNADGIGALSSVKFVLLAATATAPGQVTGVTAVPGDTEALISWTAVATATGYNVYNGVTLLNATPVATTSYKATGLTNGTAASITVKAVNAVGEGLASAAVAVTPTASGIAAAQIGQSPAVLVTWNSVASAASYKVYRNGTLLDTVTAASYTDTSVVFGVSYTYTVEAYNTTPALIYFSKASAAVTPAASIVLDKAADELLIPVIAMGSPITGTTSITAVATPTAVTLYLIDAGSVFHGAVTIIIPAGAASGTFSLPTSLVTTLGTYYVSPTPTYDATTAVPVYLKYAISGVAPASPLIGGAANVVFSGRLTNGAGSPVGGATLGLYTGALGTTAVTTTPATVTTDAAGNFVFIVTAVTDTHDYLLKDVNGAVLATWDVQAGALTATHVIDPEVVYAGQPGYAYVRITDANGTALDTGTIALLSGVTGFGDTGARYQNLGDGFWELTGTPASAGTANYQFTNGTNAVKFTINFTPMDSMLNPTIQLVQASTAIGDDWQFSVKYNVVPTYTLHDQLTNLSGPLGDGDFTTLDAVGTDSLGVATATLPVQMGGQIGLELNAMVWTTSDPLTAKPIEVKKSFKINPAIVGDVVAVDTDALNAGDTKDITVTVKMPNGIERNNGKVVLDSGVPGMFTVPAGATYTVDSTGAVLTMDASNTGVRNLNIVGGKYVFAGLKVNHKGYITVNVYGTDGSKLTGKLVDYITVSPLIHTLTADVDKLVAGQVYPVIKISGAIKALTFAQADAYGLYKVAPSYIDKLDGTYTFNYASGIPSYASLKLRADYGDDRYYIAIPIVKPTITITSVHTDGLITDSMLEKVVFTVTDPITGAVMPTSANYFKPQYNYWAVTGNTNLQVSQVVDTAEVTGVAPYIKATATTGNTYVDYTVDKPNIRLYVRVNGQLVSYSNFLTVAPAQLTITPADLVLFYGQSNTFSVKALDAHGVAIEGAKVTGTNNYNQVPAVDVFGGITGADGVVTFMYTPNYMGEIYIESADLNLTGADALTLQINPAPVDTTAPVITVAAGIDGSTVASDTLTLTGSVNEKVSSLYVGMNKVDVLPDGSFMTTVKLAAGANTISIMAWDLAGNKGTASVKVTYTAPVVKTATVIMLTIGTNIVTIDGKATSIDAAPEIVNGRAFVPIRFIAETFGATVDWLAETQGITVTLGDTTIGLQIGNATAVINGSIMSLDAAPYIKGGRTMVPLRVISEAFGGDVAWDPALRTITISYMP